MKGFRPGKQLFPLLILSALLAAGCGESGLLDLYNLEGDVEILSLPAGTVLSAGEAIPLSVRTAAEGESAEELLVTLYSREGEALGNWTLPAGENPAQLTTATLAPGYYRLDIRAVSASGRELEELELPFFISSSATRIRGISAYPSAALPKEGMVFFADLDMADDADPYLRWTAAGRTIGVGTVSEGMRLVSWRVPDSEGVYPVIVELFPFPPPVSRNFAFKAADQFRIEAFVSTDPREARGEFGPAEEYPLLFHFRGSFASGGRSPVEEPRVAGEPQLAVESGIFGYRFTSADELVYTVPALFPGRPGDPPLTLQLKGIFDGAGEILDLATPRGEELLSLARTENGLLLAIGDSSTELSLPPELMDQPRYLALRLQARNEGIAFAWYFDGEIRARGELPAVPAPAGERLRLEIGGGFGGLLDEAGFHSGPDPGIFAFAMRERFGRLLIYAGGFDGGEERIFTDRSAVASRPEPEQSRLLLPPESEAGMVLPLGEYPDGRVALRFADGGTPSLFLVAGERRLSLRIEPDPDGRIEFGWRRTGGRFEIDLGDGTAASGFEPAGGEEVELRIAAVDAAVALDSIVLTRGEASFVSQTPEETEPEA